MNEIRLKGVVRWFDNRKGFGFIEGVPESSHKDIFLHYKQSRNGATGYVSFYEGDRVEFQLGDLGKGPIALDATKV